MITTRLSPTLLTLLTLVTVLAGCATAVPSTIVQTPTTARAPAIAAAGNPLPQAPPTNGSIFQGASFRPMFEDRRARLVGDTLTIPTNERTASGKATSNTSTKNGSVDSSIGSFLGIPTTTTSKLGVTASNERKSGDTDVAAAGNNFTSTLSVTVTEVLPNGNLAVSGEKQVSLDKGNEYIRFSGVVNPNTISAGNTVSSTAVADARAEYRTNTKVDQAAITGALTRFFFSVLPL